MMPQLPKSLADWNTRVFEDTLKKELEATSPAHLPLQRAVERGSYYSGNPFQAVIIGAEDKGDIIRAKAGFFFTSIIAGCNCSDDPTPPDEIQEYCELEIDIDKKSAEVTFEIVG